MDRIYDYISPLFLIATIAFLIGVGIGYFSTFASILPDWPRPLVLLVTLFWLGLVALTIKHAAIQLYRVFAENGRGWALFLVFYIALFVFSGFGFITTFMFLYEGPVIVREKTIQMADNISRLNARAQADLPVGAYNALLARTEANRGNLMREINNPSGGNLCGIGPSARAILTSLQQDFPQVVIIRGTDGGFSCLDTARLNATRNAYNDAITAALAAHPIRTQQRIAEREQLIREVQFLASQQGPRLQELERELSGVASFVSNADLYRVALGRLTDANVAYANLYPRVAQFSPLVQTTLPPRVDLSEAQSVSSAVEVVNAITTRLHRPTVWGILLAALIIDLLFVVMVAIIYWRARKAWQARQQAIAARQVEGTTVEYIWTPPKRA
jgi:ABC-type multidrug transport system fused ATPase/permease subunit